MRILIQSFLLLLFLSSPGFQASAAPVQTTYHIKVDQFGYFTNARKFAIIVDPQQGINAAEAFSPGTGAGQYQVRRWSDDAVVFTGTLDRKSTRLNSSHT